MNVFRIESIHQQELDVYRQLTNRTVYGDAGYIICETHTVIRQALSAGCRPISFLVEDRYIHTRDKCLIESCPDVPVYVGSNAVLSELIGYPLTRGILCCMLAPENRDPNMVLSASRTVCALENIQDPSNLGAIMRNAAALGVDAVFLSPDCCSPYHRKAIRNSMGFVFRIPFYRFPDQNGWHCFIGKTLREQSFTTLAFMLSEAAQSFTQFSLPAQTKIAVFLGSEGKGLSPETSSLCSKQVYIPMSEGVDSLNVAACSAIAFWELCRKRV